MYPLQYVHYSMYTPLKVTSFVSYFEFIGIWLVIVRSEIWHDSYSNNLIAIKADEYAKKKKARPQLSFLIMYT